MWTSMNSDIFVNRPYQHERLKNSRNNVYGNWYNPYREAFSLAATAEATTVITYPNRSPS